ncbi:MAG: ABC transporter substrate-binding protein [Rickettsiales bacterium]|jgi:phospholipid transport system substrate-binding protein|nr:ABC transporter substrate-binding protein [Rickettsiales bacterium]
MKKILLLLTVFALLSPAAKAETADDVKAYSQTLVSEAIVEIFHDGNTNAKRIEKFRTVITARLDWDTIANFVLGVYARDATPEEKADFINAFREFNVYSQVKKFSAYNGQQVEVESATPGKRPGEWFATSRIKALNPSDKDLEVVWRIVVRDGVYKVQDIVIEGVSMASSFRTEYAPIMKAAADEGKRPVPELVEKISAKTAELEKNI